MKCNWAPSKAIQIGYDPDEKAAYSNRTGRFFVPKIRWPSSMWTGRAATGEFALVLTAKHFRDKGYEVWASGSRLPAEGVHSAEYEDWIGFVLLHYPGKRLRRDSKYTQLGRFFGGVEKLDALNKRTDAMKIKLKGNRLGGDPDLFVHRGKEAFFVEAKDVGDKLRDVQLLCFGEIEKRLGVRVVVANLRPLRRG